MNEIVAKNLAGTWLRLVNFVIDVLVIDLIFETITFFWVIESAKNMGFEVMTNMNMFFVKSFFINSFYYNLIILCVFVLYYFVCEFLFKGRTIGKFITGTIVVTNEGKVPTTRQFFIRSISRIVPFDPLSFLFNANGWHDRWAKTCVVKKNNFEAEFQTEN